MLGYERMACYSSRSETSKQFAIALNKRMRNYMRGRCLHCGLLMNEPDPTMLIVIVLSIRSHLSFVIEHFKLSITWQERVPRVLSSVKRKIESFDCFSVFTDVAKKWTVLSMFRSGGRGSKSEAECEVAKQYAGVANECIEAAEERVVCDSDRSSS